MSLAPLPLAPAIAPRPAPAPSISIDAIYDAQAGPLRRWLTARVRDPDAAEDIAQEAFVRLVREIQRGRAPLEPGAWLHRVASNLATSRGRRLTVADRHARRVGSPSLEPGPEVTVLDDETRDLLDAALADLRPSERAAVVLAASGHRGPEIASRIGRTEGATRTLLCRVRARLRVRLLESGYEPG